MNKYTNQQLTSAEVIAELIAWPRRSWPRPVVARSSVRRWTGPAGVLRRRGAERIRRRRHRRGRVGRHRSRTRGDHATRHPHRLDGARRRECEAADVDQAVACEAWVPAGQAARGDQTRDGPDGGDGTALCRSSGPDRPRRQPRVGSSGDRPPPRAARAFVAVPYGILLWVTAIRGEPSGLERPAVEPLRRYPWRRTGATSAGWG